LIRSGVTIGATDHDEAIKEVAIHPALFLLADLAVSHLVLVLKGSNDMCELSLVLTHNVYSLGDVHELYWGLRPGGSWQGSGIDYKKLWCSSTLGGEWEVASNNKRDSAFYLADWVPWIAEIEIK
jgi:hypothetical protein